VSGTVGRAHEFRGLEFGQERSQRLPQLLFHGLGKEDFGVPEEALGEQRLLEVKEEFEVNIKLRRSGKLEAPPALLLLVLVAEEENEIEGASGAEILEELRGETGQWR